TRRQVLSGLAAGAAFVGCGESDDPSGAGSGPSTSTSTGSNSSARSASSASSASSSLGGSTAHGASASSSASTTGAGGTGGQAPMGKAATDQVVLGSTGIVISRLAMGSGTHGNNGASDQTRLGLSQFADLLVQSYDQGITFWETADQYGAHAHLGAALSQVGRQNVVVLTKTHAQTA